jgi:hypothetical protein
MLTIKKIGTRLGVATWLTGEWCWVAPMDAGSNGDGGNKIWIAAADAGAF